jgi:methylated-DNA-[protein]-cysteine S-methyltransferase
MNPLYWTTMDSPVGELFLAGDGSSLSCVYMRKQRHRPAHDPAWIRDDERLDFAAHQLRGYFDGSRNEFDLPIAFRRGDEFERSVWRALSEIPYGETRSYGEIARQVGAPDAARAVGRANGRNPVAIVVPCHRVIGSDGSLTGYGGGLERKRWLLEFEAERAGVGQTSLL